MQRTPQNIKKDMLEWAKHHLYARSTDEWGYNTLEADPLVHLLVGACAAESKEVYDAIYDSDDRLLQRLLKYLLPETFHLPLPSVGIAKAQAKTGMCVLPDTHNLVYKEGEQTLNFTPLFETKLINGNIRFIGTDHEVLEFNETTKQNPQYVIKNDSQTLTRLLIGIETPQKLESLENTSFYIDWKGNEIEKRQLILSLSRSQWFWNEQPLKRQNGFLDAQNAAWQEHFDSEKQLRRTLNAQYQQHFHLITDTEAHPAVEMSVSDILRSWLNKNPIILEDTKSTTAKWTSVKGNFIWLRIQLPYGVQLTDVERHLTISLNHFIVVNRKLVEKDDGDTFFARSLGMEALTIQPTKGLFQGIKSVHNQLTNKPIPSMPLAQLIRSKNQTAYSVRLGGTGRFDSYNAWQRLSYMLTLFRQEHRQLEIADRLGNKMSLEELHETLGERLSKEDFKQANDGSQQQPVYLFIQPGENSHQLRAKISYWVIDGESANNLRPDSKLVSEPALAGLDPLSIRLVTTPRGAKNKYSATEQVQALQDVLFRRGRIVSANDIKSLCFQKLGNVLKDVSLRSYFETDMNADSAGVRRAIEVTLKVDKADDPYMKQLGQELELTLQENSVGTMPYRVCVVQA
jgi:hypothetical protein